MESITRFITQKLKLKVNEAKSAVARPQERKFLGFSFTTGQDIKRRIAPKSLERFKRRIRDITQRVKGVSMKTTMEELAPYMRGWRNFFGFCETPEVLVALALGPVATAGRPVASVENTTSPSCGTDRIASLWAVVQYGRQRPWPMVHRPEQSPLTGAFQCILQIARSPLLVRSLLAQLLEPPRYGPVCPVVWEGRSREAPPYPDHWHKADIAAVFGNVCSSGQSRHQASGLINLCPDVCWDLVNEIRIAKATCRVWRSPALFSRLRRINPTVWGRNAQDNPPPAYFLGGARNTLFLNVEQCATLNLRYRLGGTTCPSLNVHLPVYSLSSPAVNGGHCRNLPRP